MCPHLPPDQPGFWSVVEKVTKGPSPVRTRCHLQPGSAGRRRVLDRTARPDNPAEPRPHLRRPRTHPAHRSRGRGTHHVLQIVAMSRPWRRRPVSLLRRPGRSQRRGQPVRDHPGPASPTHQLERRSPARNERGARRTGGARLSRGPAGRPRNAAGTPSEVATHEERRQRPQLVACRALQRSVRQRGLRRRDVMACLGQRRRPAARRLDEYGRLLRVRS